MCLVYNNNNNNNNNNNINNSRFKGNKTIVLVPYSRIKKPS